MRRPDARGLTHVEALLRALWETTEDELDAGAWQKRVHTFDGPIELTFSLPFLLEAEAGRLPTRVAPTAMPRIAEREVHIARLREGRSFESNRPPHFALHSREEAAYVAETLVDAFAATDGALEWLATQAPPSPSRPRRGRRR